MFGLTKQQQTWLWVILGIIVIYLIFFRKKKESGYYSIRNGSQSASKGHAYWIAIKPPSS